MTSDLLIPLTGSLCCPQQCRGSVFILLLFGGIVKVEGGFFICDHRQKDCCDMQQSLLYQSI